MSADAARRLHEQPNGAARPGSVVCTLAGPDGQAIGTLTIDLEPMGGPAGAGDALPGPSSAILSGSGETAGELRLRLPATWSDHGPPELAIHAVLVRDGAALPRVPLAELVAGYERGLIEDALRATRGNRARAARLLQTTERILGYRIQQYGIDCAEFRKSRD